MRRGKGDRGLGGGRCFIGLDLSDPTAENKRPCDYAVLDSDLVCTFGQWEYREDAARIIPDRALGRSFILAIDGPQGLAVSPGPPSASRSGFCTPRGARRMSFKRAASHSRGSSKGLWRCSIGW